MAVRAMMVDIVKLANGIIPGTKEGDHLLSFPGGVQFIVPQAVIDNLDPAKDDEPITTTPQRKPTARPQAPIRQPSTEDDRPEKEDLDTRICNECGKETKQVMPSGRCYECATVRCPTCRSEVRRADMIGQYCPTCLPRGRD